MEKQFKFNLNLLWIIPLVLIIFWSVGTCFYTVGETEKAVVTTFGKVTGVQSAGLQFKLPYPIQDIRRVDMTTRKLTLGYREDDNSITSNVNESKMITGDYNVVSVDFFMEWKVSDPQKFLYKAHDPDMILLNVAQAAARDVMGSKNVDDVLTTGKVSIQTEIKDLMLTRLEAYDIGVQILDVKIQDAEPPTLEVVDAFKAVETAKQEKDTTINQAKAYENSVLPDAAAQADKILKDAEAYKEQRINEAKGDIAKFNEMYKEYALNPDITRKRMYLEMIEDVLPGVDLYIDASTSGIQKLLPLDSFTTDGGPTDTNPTVNNPTNTQGGAE